jgi:chromosome segregation ATPase
MSSLHNPLETASREAMWIDRWGFLTCFLIGATWILVTKFVGFPQLLITAVTIGIMVFYAVIIWKAPRMSLREDQAGDNLYYLGLLLTLISLGYALFVFDVTAGTQQIVQSFGLALATTIAGLALRVWFNQMRQNIIQVEKEVRFALTEAANRLRAELDQTVVALNDFSRTTVQSTADGIAEIRERIETALEKSAETLTSSHSDVSDRLKTAFERLEGHSDKFQKSAADMASSVEEHTVALQNISSGATVLDKNIDALVKASTTAEHGLNALIKRTQEMQAAHTTLQSALTTGNELLEKQSDVTAELQRVVETLGAQLASAAGKWEQEVDSALQGVTQKNEQGFSLFTRELERLQERQVQALRGLSEATEDIGQTLRNHRDTLRSELSDARAYSTQIQSSLAEVADAIVAKLPKKEAPDR